MDEYAEQRRRLVEELREAGIKDQRVLGAIGRVPREAFVAERHRADAYRNAALPIGKRQTISQPFVVALMTQELQLTGVEHVLEVGTGSGYQAAILAELAASVVSVERHPDLLARARRALDALGYSRVVLHLANGSLGWPESAPYDRIVVTAAGPDVPKPLLDQLAPGGRLVMPVGTTNRQDLVLVERRGESIHRRAFAPVRFVPLVGAAGWEATDERRETGDERGES